ncbi:MAG: hypothetical protein DPW13_01805 [Planctomycetes bacterium]|nr:hypothetical protein [Planctomycetota bacterium]
MTIICLSIVTAAPAKCFCTAVCTTAGALSRATVSSISTRVPSSVTVASKDAPLTVQAPSYTIARSSCSRVTAGMGAPWATPLSALRAASGTWSSVSLAAGRRGVSTLRPRTLPSASMRISMIPPLIWISAS